MRAFRWFRLSWRLLSRRFGFQALCMQQGAQIGCWAEVGKLVRVDNRADAPDLTAGDVERQHADEALLCVKNECSWAVVDLDGAQRHAGDARAEDQRLDQRARDAVAAAQRARQGGHLAAAVASQLNVVGEQRLEPRKVALLGGSEEPPGQLVALLTRGLEAGPTLLDVASCSRRELTDVVLALADDLGDLRVVVVEHIVQDQRSPLLRREALEQHEQRQRQRVGCLSVLSRIIAAVGDDRLRQPLADVALATRARSAAR